MYLLIYQSFYLSSINAKLLWKAKFHTISNRPLQSIYLSIYLFSDRGDGGGGVVIVHGGNGSAPVAGKGKITVLAVKLL